MRRFAHPKDGQISYCACARAMCLQAQHCRSQACRLRSLPLYSDRAQLLAAALSWHDSRRRYRSRFLFACFAVATTALAAVQQGHYIVDLVVAPAQALQAGSQCSVLVLKQAHLVRCLAFEARSLDSEADDPCILAQVSAALVQRQWAAFDALLAAIVLDLPVAENGRFA